MGREQFAISGAACGLGEARPDGLHTLYWEALGQTEVCIKAEVKPASVTVHLY